VPSSEREQNHAIDELYQVPPNEFTAKRNALVKTMRGADATRVRTLAKPSIVAWAVNQVYWRARPLYDRVIKSGERLRHAQIAALERKPADVRSASDTHRRAVAEAVAEAERLARAAGSRPAADALTRTFEALSLAAEPPAHPGRLSDALQPAGFEALAGITPTAAAATTRAERDRRGEAGGGPPARPPASAARGEPPSKPQNRRDTQAERARQREEAAAARRQAAEEKKRQAEIHARQADVDRAKATEASARADWERARDALRKAEERLAAITRV
jgi:hypothetical protein